MRYAHEIRFTEHPSHALNGHIAWYRLILHVGDHLRSV